MFLCSSPASTPCLPSAGPTDTLRHHLPLVSRFWGHEGLPALGWMEAGVGRFICYRKTWLHGLTGEEGALSRGFEAQEQWGAVPVASKPRCCLFFFHSCRQPAAAESLVTSALSPSGRGLQCLVPPSKRAALAAFQLTQVGKLRPRLYSIQRLIWHVFLQIFLLSLLLCVLGRRRPCQGAVGPPLCSMFDASSPSSRSVTSCQTQNPHRWGL